MASIWIAQGFIGIVKVIELNIFCFYFFSSLLGKLQASTSSRTLGGDHECGRYEE